MSVISFSLTVQTSHGDLLILLFSVFGICPFSYLGSCPCPVIKLFMFASCLDSFLLPSLPTPTLQPHAFMISIKPQVRFTLLSPPQALPPQQLPMPIKSFLMATCPLLSSPDDLSCQRHALSFVALCLGSFPVFCRECQSPLAFSFLLGKFLFIPQDSF